MRIIGGYQDTRKNGEDFAITPYLFGVLMIGSIMCVYGIGICWGWHSAYIGIGKNIPKDYPSFKTLKGIERNNK